ncbi:KNOTTED1-like homeobox gene 3 [Hibiscus trionum]|uniref:KNOTTED1-like homeobox gene 3 n=1 Tax=Hibiscus trionum TaxID=183268 RepID=A0A9W7MBZ2_HIBTR|nr:KNOTTED1-like homeobox gene 3 [Hibiscus trionum]
MAFHNNGHLPLQRQAETTAPNWLNAALHPPHQPQPSHPNFLNLRTTTTASDSTVASQAPNSMLSRSSSSLLHRNHSEVIDEDAAAAVGGGGRAMAVESVSGDFKTSISETMHNNNNNKRRSEGVVPESGGGGGGDGDMSWQNARYKAEILAHPFYDQLLAAHVACLRIATPVDQLPRIDAQLAQSQHVVAKYSALGGGSPGLVSDDKELDQFMTQYVLLLCSFKEQLQQHVRVHAMEAVMACWEIEQSLQTLTGVSPGEGTGATMSDDDDDQADSDANLFDANLEGPDSMGFGPLVPTESERSLMERVRHELKHELKQGYKEKIVDIREEILRKRRAGKLPGDTTSVLKAWWKSHSKWPYPTEEDKARLVQETGLELKQINNWFINQRKRNWHSDSSTSTISKSKRKR